MFDDLTKELGNVEIHSPSRHSGARYLCLRCQMIKGGPAFAAVARGSKAGICFRCSTYDEKMESLSLPPVGHTRSKALTSVAEQLELIKQPVCSDCKQEAIGGLVKSTLRDVLICQKCYDLEVQRALEKLRREE